MPQNQVKSTLLAVILLIPITIISACSQTVSETPVEVIEIERNKPKLVLPPLSQITTLDVNWNIITKDNIEEKFKQLEENNSPLVIYGLDQKNYENLSINMASVLKLTQEQRSRINSYKNYYENN